MVISSRRCGDFIRLGILRAPARRPAVHAHVARRIPHHDFPALEAGWGVGLGAVYRSDLYPNINNEVLVKGYTRYDAAVFFDVNESIALQLNIENIFDKEYFVSAHNNDNISPGSPRAAYLSVNFSF